MSRSFDGFAALFYAGVPFTDGPFTYSAWVWLDSTAIRCMLGLGENLGNTVQVRTVSGGSVEFVVMGSGGTRSITTVGQVAQQTWTHILCSSTAGGQSMRAIVNGTLDTNSGSNLTVALTSRYNIAQRNDGGNRWIGYLAEFTLWDAVLSSGEETALARRGNSFNVRPGNLVSYVPMWRAEDEDYVQGASFSIVTGSPGVAVHPSIIHQLPRTYFLPAAPAADERAVKSIFIRSDRAYQIAALGV